MFSWITVVKTPFALFYEKMEVLFGNTIKLAQMAFGLIPKVFDIVDMVGSTSKQLTVIYTKVLEFTHIKSIVIVK